MAAWQVAHVLAMLPRAMDDLGSVCLRIECAVWHDTHVAATVSPLFIRASPWIDSE